MHTVTDATDYAAHAWAAGNDGIGMDSTIS